MKPVARHYADAAEYLAAFEGFLLEDEPLNSLILGVIHRLRRSALPRRRRPPILLSVNRRHDPVLVAAMTPPQKLLIAGRADDPEAIGVLVEDLIASGVDLPGVLGPSPLATLFAQRWSSARPTMIMPGMGQTLYEAREVIFPPDLPDGDLGLPHFADRDQLAQWVWAFQNEALPEEAADLEASRLIADRVISQDDLFVWKTELGGRNQPVSMAARARPTSRGIAINLVYTPPEHRRRGYATACVAHLTKRLLDEGWEFCTLFTDRTNPTSNKIYQRIGYQPLADFDEIRFKPDHPG